MKEIDRFLKFNIEAATWAGVWPCSSPAEAASLGARCFSGSKAGCNLEMGIKPPKGVVICRNGGDKNTFGVHITNCKRLNSDNVIFAMHVKCLANSAEQRKRDKLADIY
jgi:hypothetical protein